jgi:MoaA/NifB/PqqE/SkfB family radical SAM enzyme
MTSTLAEADLALLTETLGRGSGPRDASPLALGTDYIRSASRVLVQRLQMEIRVRHLVAEMAAAGVAEAVVYGSAEVGRAIARTALGCGIAVPCFVESALLAEGTRVDGIEVIQLGQALAEGFRTFALGSLLRAREMADIIRAAHPGLLRLFPPPALGDPLPGAAPELLVQEIARREGLIATVLEGDPGLFGALLGRFPRESPEPPAQAPAAAAHWAEGPLDPRLLRPMMPLVSASLQFTGDCNLKCTYCGHAQSGWSGTRMTEPLLDSILDFILKDGTRKVMVGFFGEATLFPGWEQVCQRLLDGGIDLATNSNFLRPLRPEEVEVLSRFTEVAMSIDTVDQDLQKRLRPPMDVRNLVHSFHRIRGHALAEGRRGPHFIWTGVLTPEVVPRLPEFLAYARSCGVTHVNLNEICPIEESAGQDSLDDLDGEAFVRMAGQLREAVTLAGTLGLHLTVPLERITAKLERIRRRSQGEACPEPRKVRIKSFQGTACYPFERIPEGKVGLCVAPWTGVHVMPTGEVFPCCFQNQVMGVVDERHSLAGILENDSYQAFRAALLTGRHLNETCRHCLLVQKVVDPSEERAAVAELLGIKPEAPS